MVELFCDSFGAVPKRILLDIDDTEDLVHGGSRCFNGEGEKVRRYGDFDYAAKSWTVERRVIARVEAGPQGADSRFIVTKLPGLPKSLYEKVYCARGQAENLIKAHKLYLASDRTSCHKATANQFRLLIHTAAYWLMLTLRGLASRTSFWREAQFNPIRLCLIKVAARVTEMVTRIKIALPTAYPYRIGFTMVAGRIARLPHPVAQCLARAADLLGNRVDRRPLRGVLALVVQNHPNRASTDLRGIARNSLRHRSILSRGGASDKPGAVQP